MRYLPVQAKEAIGISEETFRHWRRTLPPLRGKRGYGPCFSPGDLLALKVIAQFHALGIQVRYLAPHADALFLSCSEGPWFGLDNKAIIFDGASIALVGPTVDQKWGCSTHIVVPLRPLISELRQSLSSESVHPTQSDIVFPPFGVSKGRSA